MHELSFGEQVTQVRHLQLADREVHELMAALLYISEQVMALSGLAAPPSQWIAVLAVLGQFIAALAVPAAMLWGCAKVARRFKLQIDMLIAQLAQEEADGLPLVWQDLEAQIPQVQIPPKLDRTPQGVRNAGVPARRSRAA